MTIGRSTTPVKRYLFGNAAAAVGSMVAWALVRWAAEPLDIIMWGLFGASGFLGLNCIWFLPGWREMVQGVLLWAVIWIPASIIAVVMLFEI